MLPYRMPNKETLGTGEQSQAYELGEYNLVTLQVDVTGSQTTLEFYATIDGVSYGLLKNTQGNSSEALGVGSHTITFPLFTARAVSCKNVTGGSAKIQYQMSAA